MCLFRKWLYPDAMVDQVDDIPFEALYDKGYRVLLFDIDNTIVPHDAPADDHARALFQRLRAIGFSCVLVSNNREARVKPFADAVGASYVYLAKKPSAEGMRRAMQKGGGHKDNTIVIGDQLFTDIWGASNIGVKSVLTKMIHPREKLQIVLKRRLEKIVLIFYRRYVRRRGYVTQGESFFI